MEALLTQKTNSLLLIYSGNTIVRKRLLIYRMLLSMRIPNIPRQGAFSLYILMVKKRIFPSTNVFIIFREIPKKINKTKTKYI